MNLKAKQMKGCKYFYYPIALKGCRGIVFTHAVRIGGQAFDRAVGWEAGKSLFWLYLRNHKVKEVHTW